MIGLFPLNLQFIPAREAASAGGKSVRNVSSEGCTTMSKKVTQDLQVVPFGDDVEKETW